MKDNTDSQSVDAEDAADDLMPEATPTRGMRMRSRILRSTALLPAMFTVGNGLCGFAAIHFATKAPPAIENVSYLAVAAWFIIAAMVCDMLDGRLARMTRKTSDFGAQLDSLSDMVSFGVAPAMMMVRAVFTSLHDQGIVIVLVERIVLCIAGVYVACAALRLARFNVENVPDESAHMNFSGLPSPGAAANIATLILLFEHLCSDKVAWLPKGWLMMGTSVVLSAVTLAGALLMVSRIKYPHIVNQYIRGKKPFNYLVKLIIVAFAALLQPLLTAAVLSVGYLCLGLLAAAWRKTRPEVKATE